MIEIIIVLGLIVTAGLIIQNHLEKKAIVEFFDRAKEVYEAEKDEMIEFDAEDFDWYGYLDFCLVCDDVIFEDEAIIIFPDDEGVYMTFCEYCLNPDLKDE